MKRYLIPCAVIATLLVEGMLAPAQTRFTQRGYPNVTDAYQSGLKLYSKTWSDLNGAQKAVAPNPGDWYRFDVARGQMDFLERTWQDGTFNRPQINSAISDVQFVLKFNNLASGSRELLAEDLEQLRDIRVRYGR